jgi:hypothetical protein
MRFIAFMLGDIDTRFLDGIESIAEASDSDEHAMSRLRSFAAERADRKSLAEWPKTRIEEIQRIDAMRTGTSRLDQIRHKVHAEAVHMMDGGTT